KVEEKRRSGDKTRWVTIENRTESRAFKCKDVSGTVKVHPQHAEVISHHKETDKRGNRRYTERTIRLSDKVYVLGFSKVDRDTGDSLEIRNDKKQRPFLITNLTEQTIMMRKAHTGMLSLTTAFSTLMFAFLFYLGSQGNFSPSDYLLGSLIAPVYMSLIVLVLHYNDLIFLKQRAARNFSNIKVSMQKRADLVPNLEKIVKQYFAHEKSLLTQVTELRNQFKLDAEEISEIEDRLLKEQNLLSSLIALKESNPNLKSDKLSLKLMNKLIDLENEIALMREGYNDAVTYYNTRIATIPDLFFARAFGFKAIELMTFETKKFARVEF
ncbi:MAG: LemA family protein, partial [Kangiellaceae bacterium]|nr:LemA family protein [Kangiellaceae bacterium]